MDRYQPLIALQIEEDAIVADPLTECGGMVLQWQDVSPSWVERKPVERSIDSTAIIQRKPSQVSSRAVREDQLPGHA